MKTNFVLSLVFLTSLEAASWKERKEFKLNHPQINLTIPVPKSGTLELNNRYGDIIVKLVPQKVDVIKVSGILKNDTGRSVSIQVLTFDNGNLEFFLDGPAEFKSHDHIKKYGKPLDRAFFESHVDVIPEIKRLDDGSITVGTLGFTLNARGGFTMGRTQMWGRASFSSDLKLYEGTAIGTLPAEADLTFEVPVALARNIEINSKKASKATVVFEAGLDPSQWVEKRSDDASVTVAHRDCSQQLD